MSTPIKVEPTCEINKAVIGLLQYHPRYRNTDDYIITIDVYLMIRKLIQEESKKPRLMDHDVFWEMVQYTGEIIDHEMP